MEKSQVMHTAASARQAHKIPCKCFFRICVVVILEAKKIEVVLHFLLQAIVEYLHFSLNFLFFKFLN